VKDFLIFGSDVIHALGPSHPMGGVLSGVLFLIRLP